MKLIENSMICAACHNPGGQTEAGYCNECEGSGHMTTGQAVDYESRINIPVWIVICFSIAFWMGISMLWRHC